MATTPPTGFADFLAEQMPKYPDPSNWLSASMPKPADVTASQTPASPPPLAWLATGDTVYRVLWLDYTRPSSVLSKTRPTITAVISLPTSKDALSIFRSAITGGTAALLVDGRTVTAYDAHVDSLISLASVTGYTKSPDGSSAAIVKISADPDKYRAD